MSYEIKIPASGESVTSALVAQWQHADGATIQKGDVLATLETDKVSQELETESAGVLKIIIPEGEEGDIGAVIGTITQVADAPAPAATSAPAPAAQAAAPAPSGGGATGEAVSYTHLTLPTIYSV